MTQDNLATRIDIDYDACVDTGKHYRYMYKGVKLDPYRICKIYRIDDFALQTIVKKALCAGLRGHKSRRQDLLDIITAAKRAIEMLDEDEAASH
jgi:hypothetical protein